jgi:acyl carrier protein
MTFAEILHDEFDGKVGLEDEIDDAPIDSLEYLSFIKRLEAELRIEISDEKLSGLETFEDIEALTEVLAGHA